MPKKFLTAEWRKLILANYPVEASVLTPYLPAHTELEYWNNKVYVSLVGFMFMNTRVFGIKIPFHINFPEVNLRFYVRYNDKGNWKRGVVFIKEIVPRPAISLVANTIFNEHYITLPVTNTVQTEKEQLTIGYNWKYRNNWNKLEVQASPVLSDIKTNSEAEFFTEQFWGYSVKSIDTTSEYEVKHPRWKQYVVNNYTIECDFAALYGEAFSYLAQSTPASVILAEGSQISVHSKRVI